MIIRGVLYHNKGLKKLFFTILLTLFAVIPSRAQTIIGTNGMMNVPTADMRPAGTFDGGASFILGERIGGKPDARRIIYAFTDFHIRQCDHYKNPIPALIKVHSIENVCKITKKP
jgi:hypothetical protein